MGPEYDVCVVEDCPDTLRMIQETLTRAGFACRVAPDGAKAWELILHHQPKMVLSDWHMPELDGLELCHRLRDHPELADRFFVLMTAHATEGSKTLALCSGADDYLTKPIDSDELVARMRVGQRLWAMQERLRRAAHTDGLTGLCNHDHLTQVLEREINRARRYGGSLSFIMLDLDYFKAVNDSYGHLVGNRLLQQVADVLRRAVRDVDSIGRFGGDEFAIIAPEATLEDATVLAERVRTALAEYIHLEENPAFTLSASIGVACTDDLRVSSAADLVNLADRAMYLAKRTGRGHIATAKEPDDDKEEVEDLIQVDDLDSLRRQLAVLSVHAKEVYLQSIAALGQVLDEKDPYTARHSVNVSMLAEHVARELGCSNGTINAVRNAGMLHDIGKVGVPDRILMKPGPLTPAERTVMNQVPLISARIVDPLRILEAERQIIRHQREHFDGSGIPDEMVGDAIPIGARVLLVADAFDAMTTDRIYRPARSIGDALAELKRHARTQFDPRVVGALARWIDANRHEWQRVIDETVLAFPVAVGVELP